MIPYGRQDISDEDVQAVVDVLRSDWLTQGPAIPRFEEALAAYCGVDHAVAVCNATAALHLACLALGLAPGDRLWTTPNTFVASANCGRYCGATVDFVDIDPETYNLCPTALAQKLEQAARRGELPKVVVPVDFGGQSCRMDEIGRLAQQYGFRIVEDASHAIGGEYRGKKIGACEHADAAVFSFHPVKVMTTGEGGAVLTRDKALAEKIRLLRSHGITRDPAHMETPAAGGWYYEQIDLGFNYRMTDLQAALGVSQLRRLEAFVSRRRRLARRYDALLADLPVKCPRQDPDGLSAWHLYPILIDSVRCRRSREQVFNALRGDGIGVNVHYIPVHTQPDYRRLGFKSGDFPRAEAYYAGAISLPLYFGLTEKDQDTVVASLRRALS